jgi:hypothetical protein
LGTYGTQIRRRAAAIASLGVALALLLFMHVDVAHGAATVSTRGDTVVLLNTNAATGSSTFTLVKPMSVTCNAASDISASGIKVEAPAGWTFDTTANAVSFAVTGTGTLRINNVISGTTTAVASGTATAGPSEIAMTVATPCAVGDILTITGIKVRPGASNTAGGNIGIALDGTSLLTGPGAIASVATLSASGFDRPISVVGVNPAVWSGGTVDSLAASVTGVGGISVTTFVNGGAVVLIPGAPAFVNAAFNATYPSGVPVGTIVLVTK